MPTAKLPIYEEAYRNSDEMALIAKNSRLYDGYLDELGATHMRPALYYITSVNSVFSVTGIFWWAEKQIVAAIVGSHFYTLTPTSAISSINSYRGLASITYWNDRSPAICCTDGTYVFAANGNAIHYFSDTANVQRLTMPLYTSDLPTRISHVAYLDGYILCNNLGSNKFHWSKVNNSLTWEALNYASAKGSPDTIVALWVVNREIYLFGPNSFEIWEHDGETPFSRIPGGFQQIGCIAPYSIVNIANTLYWLDDRCRIVRCSGHNVEHLSGPYDKEISQINSPSNCRTYTLNFRGHLFIIFNFIGDKRTFVYDTTVNQWSEWGSWNVNTGSYDMWPISGACFVPIFNTTFIGTTIDDSFYVLSNKQTEDNGTIPIRTSRRTGHIDHGTSKSKISKELRIRIKRGNTPAVVTQSMKLIIRWKDDNINTWSPERWFDLGKNHDTEMIVRMFRNGTYRSRQWEFTIGWVNWDSSINLDSDPSLFLDAEEDVEVLQ